MAEHQEERPELELDDGHIFVYVGGPKPYIWIGSRDGTFYDSVDIDVFKDFVSPLRRSHKTKTSA